MQLHNSLHEVFEDDDAIKAFAAALEKDEFDTIVSVPDWAPIRQRIKKLSGLKRDADVIREGWAYDLSRWPLLALLWFLICTEFLLYVIVRQLVNLLEYSTYWWGKKGKLRTAMRAATTYADWQQAALKMDEYLGFNNWKRTASYSYYDSALIRRVRENLKELRKKDDFQGVKTVLEICLRSNFGGIESGRLYSETYMGTKDSVEDYLSEVQTCLEYVRTTDKLALHEKQSFYKSVSRHFGTTALALSGGASLGYYHFGIVKALLDQDLLPRVVSGTSAGALVAALICCRTNEELLPIVVPELADKITALEDDFKTWTKRFWKTGARFDAVLWAEKAMFFTLGSMTFKEAYERTGRILNVSVIPYETHSPTKLLNYITAPDCVIYTACIASAAVPGLLQPVVLMNKTASGQLIPWQFQGRHKDGSLRVDIPLQSLHLLFNCNFSVVSQVNPHISLFFFQPKGAVGRPVAHRRGRGWRGGYLLSAAEQILKIELTKNFRLIRDLELMPEFGGQNWTNVFLQKFEGSVTIWPKSRFKDWLRLLKDPDPTELARMIDVGQKATWPKLHMIANRQKIEREIDLGRQEIRKHLRNIQPAGYFSPALEAAEVTSAFETDSEFELNANPQNGKRPSAKRYLSLDALARQQSVLEHDTTGEGELYPQPEQDLHDSVDVQDPDKGRRKAANKARKKAFIRKLGFVRKDGADSASSFDVDNPRTGLQSDGREEVKARRALSMGSLRLADKIKGDQRRGFLTDEDTEDEGSST